MDFRPPPVSATRLVALRRLAIAGLSIALLFAAPAAAPAQTTHKQAPAGVTTTKPSQPRPGIARLEKRIAALRDQLGITAAQHKPWRAVVTALRANEAELYAVTARRAGHIRSAGAVENLHLYGLVAAVHAANIQRLAAAFEPLYKTLDGRQKKIADTILRDAREGALSDGF